MAGFGSFFASVAVFVLVSSPWAAALAQRNCLTGNCHHGLAGTRYLHGPVAAEMAGVKACEMCHIPAGTKCTSKRAGRFKIKRKGLCLLCHDKGTGTQHSVREVESKCLNCHDPHGSEISPYFLRASKKELMKKR